MRVVLPARPGALGAVASAVGAIGADINLVEIVERRPGAEVDELILDLPATQTVASLVEVCDALDGVEVQWVRNYPRGGGIEYDIELQRRMAAESDRAGEVLVAAAPLVFRADWSLLVDVAGAPRVTFASPAAPALAATDLERFGPFDSTHRVALDEGWLPGWEDHHAAVSPMADHRAVVVGRRGDPPFFRSELARLDHLAGGGAGTALVSDEAAGPGAEGRHRHPIAPPLYARDEAS
jgi:hypothetical protein